MTLAAPALLDPFHVVPAQARVTRRSRPHDRSLTLLACPTMLPNVRRHFSMPMHQRGFWSPGWIRLRSVGGVDKTVLDVFVALAQDLQVQRQHLARCSRRPWRGRSGWPRTSRSRIT